MKAPRTNTGVNVLKDREHLKQGSPNLNRRVSMLGNIIDVKYPGEQSSSSGIQVLIRFEDGQSPIHWFTLAEDYALCITVMGNRDAVKALQPRCIYTYHPTSFFSGIAKLTTDRTQTQTFLGFLKNLSNAAVGFFGGLLGGVDSPPGTDVPPFTPVAPAKPAGPANGAPVAPPIPGINYNPADTAQESTQPSTQSAVPLGPEPAPPAPAPSLTPAEELTTALRDPRRKAELDAIFAKSLPWLHTSKDGVFTVTTLSNKSIIVPVKYITTENVDKWIANPPTRGQYTETASGAQAAATAPTTPAPPVTSAPALTGKKVLLIGSSSAVGVGSKLKAMLLTLGIKEFRNIGKGSTFLHQWANPNSEQGKLLTRTLETYNPEVVFLFVGTNDEAGGGLATREDNPAVQNLYNSLQGRRSFFIGLPPHTRHRMIPAFRNRIANVWGSDMFYTEGVNPQKAVDNLHLSQQGYNELLAALKPWLQDK